MQRGRITAYGKAKRNSAKASKDKKQKQKTVVTNIQEREQEERILKEFDLNYQFGPCVGIGRLTRWKRAQSLGLNPPKIVLEILERRGSEVDEDLFQTYKNLI
ncbi:hypothetical protein GAYE_SCF19G3994 [Galdieria yellowstonensis]|uniref:DNA polymerase delta subunit 4 n=1 Tax=Galdieria yellowstonensis TaxID=3028027 RepID=A0AAV9IFF8_9RHOD|nr:hypothetical protein GAYE_SCF19G3994 [Galdieria yellowstonensis]